MTTKFSAIPRPVLLKPGFWCSCQLQSDQASLRGSLTLCWPNLWDDLEIVPPAAARHPGIWTVRMYPAWTLAFEAVFNEVKIAEWSSTQPISNQQLWDGRGRMQEGKGIQSFFFKVSSYTYCVLNIPPSHTRHVQNLPVLISDSCCPPISLGNLTFTFTYVFRTLCWHMKHRNHKWEKT